MRAKKDKPQQKEAKGGRIEYHKVWYRIIQTDQPINLINGGVIGDKLFGPWNAFK